MFIIRVVLVEVSGLLIAVSGQAYFLQQLATLLKKSVPVVIVGGYTLSRLTCCHFTFPVWTNGVMKLNIGLLIWQMRCMPNEP